MATFVTGVVVGAGVRFLADWFTDRWRAKKRAREEEEIWHEVEQTFPDTIAEMRADLSTDECRNIRTFFVGPTGVALGFSPEPALIYHQEQHPDLQAALAVLEQHGFISGITPSPPPKYRIHDKLANRLTK